VTFKIRNTSKVTVAGREVPQVYISDPKSSLPCPVKELKGLLKVSLIGGGSKNVDLSREALGF
jgi:beta-glucosidase